MTEITVINRALRELGQPPIQSILDQSNAGRIAIEAWPLWRQTFLSLYPVHGAKITVVLAQHTEDPVGDRWDRRYVLPDAFLTMLSFNGSFENLESNEKFDIQLDRGLNQQLLLTSELEAIIECTVDLQNVGVLKPDVLLTMAIGLANDIKGEFPIPDSTRLQIEARFERALERMEAKDSMQGTLPLFRHDHLLRARSGRTRLRNDWRNG